MYDQIRVKIRDLPGTVFQETMRQLAPTRGFARALLGTVGEVLKEQMDANPGKYVVGDQVGQFGPAGGVRRSAARHVGRARGHHAAARTRTDGDRGRAGAVLQSEPKHGQPLKTTLDQKVQNAADAALVGQPNDSALVAIRVSDGADRSRSPTGRTAADVNLAFTASVPPGSTFKMVTALGLLDANAVSLDTPVNCPKTFTVEGRTFNNANNFELGNGAVPGRLRQVVQHRVRVAGAQARRRRPAARPPRRSASASPWSLGTEVFTGTVPANASAVEAAAAAFGQGQTVVSPLALAGATAAVARGSWQQPKLFTERRRRRRAERPAPPPTAPRR